MTLKFGLIGFGHFGKHYARLLGELPGASLVAVADSSQDSLTQHRDLLPQNIFATTNAAEVFNNPAVDCIIVATPASTHFTIVSAALRAGKHVLVEKPLALSIKEAEVIQKLAQNNQQTCMVGFQYVYNDYVLALKTLLPRLGAIHYCYGEHQAPGPVRSDVGSFADAGTHDLSMIYFLWNPGKVTRVTGGALLADNLGRDNFAAAALKFSSGLRAHLLTTYYAPEKVRKFTVIGELGIAQMNDRAENNKLKFWPYKMPRFAHNTAPSSSLFLNLGDPEIPSIYPREPLRNELEHFIKCVRDGKKPITDADFGYEVTQASLNIQERLLGL